MHLEHKNNLPTDVLQLKKEIEKAAGVEVFWQQDDDLGGSMSEQWVSIYSLQ